MQRIRIAERAQWRARAEAAGFRFHTIDGQPYWDESAYYAFTLRQIEQDIEDPSAELHQMALDLVGDVIGSERLMDQLAIPSHYRDWIADSWRQRQPHLYSRLDLAYDGTGPAKLYELNYDTPTSLFEASFFQWQWLEDQRNATACRSMPTSSMRSMRRWSSASANWPRSCRRRCTSARWEARKKTVALSITCATARRRPACMARPSRSRTSACPRTVLHRAG